MNFARAGARVTAVDLSSRSLELARQRAEVFGLQDRITFIEADAERLAEFVEPSPSDLRLSFGVIHHTPNPGRALEQIRRHFVGPRHDVQDDGVTAAGRGRCWRSWFARRMAHSGNWTRRSRGTPRHKPDVL